MQVGTLVKRKNTPTIGIITGLNRWDQRPLVFVQWTVNPQGLPDTWWHKTKLEVVCK